MRLRLGFVSNSSSSSFVIRELGLRPINVAIEMTKIVLDEYQHRMYSTRDTLYIRRVQVALEQLERDVHAEYPPTAILLPFTVNYPTWISERYFADGVAVITCHNHEWDYLPWELGDLPEEEDHVATSADWVSYPYWEEK